MEVEKGRAQAAQAIARRLLAMFNDRFNDQQIAEFTELSPEAVAALRAEQG
jgi:hypothetical protein